MEARSDHAYLKLKRALDQKVARQTLPPHPFCLQDLAFQKSTRAKLFYGGLTHSDWTLRLFCRGAFELTYTRVEGDVPVVVDTLEGFYTLSVAPDADPDGYVALPLQTGTLAATVSLHCVLRYCETRSPVHWEEDTQVEAIPFDHVYAVQVHPPWNPEYVSMRGLMRNMFRPRHTADPDWLPLSPEEPDVLMQRNRELAKITPSIPLRLNRSLMPTDVDTRSPARFYNTGPLSSLMRKSFSTGALRACGPSPGYGFSQRAMHQKGNQLHLVRAQPGTTPTVVAKPSPCPSYSAIRRQYG
jgi:hypothetical protein